MSYRSSAASRPEPPRSRLDRLAAVGADPADGPDERLRKATLTLAAAVIGVLALVWTGLYLALGRTLPALIPLAYSLVSALSLVALARTKRYARFRTSQVALMLVLPFVLQWSLGGFVEGSAVAVWAFIAPLGAIVFHGPRESLPWFAAFAFLLVASPAIEAVFPAGEGLGETARTVFFVLNTLGPLGVAFVLLQYFVRERDREHERSERLLLNILPASVAERLKAADGVIADGCDEVTVVFADLVGFTAEAARMAPNEVVAVLNEVVSAFDDLVERHGLEKIKTIGDGYMAAAGIPEPCEDHAHAAAAVALAMRDCVAALPGAAAHDLGLRVGIASGPVVAGVIGRSKFGYDLWGDTVNTASRMEAYAPAGTIQVTAETARRLAGRFRLEPRGPVEVRGKGAMETYLLLGEA